ncbi:MAG: hypothetical protein COU31_00465 [Candidatus Magasanikbacteria bacterium CG10_big_fil_rev_8_21_14_0_10_40_10]|uniref:Uncharacterized protein n=1 Tax=Candidatus Magasanikbacteria bacterium CG10_big_fil_rev_8_21_14_0_10_40_10 TaxID=1974648 RepID=A0A2M6W588_9BACT|nr:MAG: hypothetical protein COU31_00465 [Candidatus Magasanikbacteria bacterium CG10_big_fil_rev_8_21_14_0_10_40_10]
MERAFKIHENEKKCDRLIEVACRNIQLEFAKQGTARDRFVSHAFPLENLSGLVKTGGLQTVMQLKEQGIIVKTGSDAPHDYQASVSPGQILTGYSSQTPEGRSYGSSHMEGGLAIVFPKEELARAQNSDYERKRLLNLEPESPLEEALKIRKNNLSLGMYGQADTLRKEMVPGTDEYRHMLQKHYEVGAAEISVDLIGLKNNEGPSEQADRLSKKAAIRFENKVDADTRNQIKRISEEFARIFSFLKDNYNIRVFGYNQNRVPSNYEINQIKEDITQLVYKNQHRQDLNMGNLKERQDAYDEFLSKNQEILSRAFKKREGKIKWWQRRKLTNEEDESLKEYKDLEDGLGYERLHIEDSQHKLADLKNAFDTLVLLEQIVHKIYKEDKEKKEIANQGRNKRRERMTKRLHQEEKEKVWDRAKMKLTHGFFLIPQKFENQARQILKDKPGLADRALVYDEDRFFSANVVFQDLNRTREGVEYLQSLLRGEKTKINISGIHQLEL